MNELLPRSADPALHAAPSSRTWKINWTTGRLENFIDGSEALRQALLLALLTPRFSHVIYSFHYGSELESLIGKDRSYAESAAPALAKEALCADDRVRDTADAVFHAEKNTLSGSVTALSANGFEVIHTSIIKRGNSYPHPIL